ncbi:hypothetical protein [Crateriforma spongiae]|uniref:hypothetical protein n=1 Tax=Crateriforma spongiae TaxID=2724528 RepID=UPI001446A841|nr:hypothetical protein [Crateriforma spongiae]
MLAKRRPRETPCTRIVATQKTTVANKNMERRGRSQNVPYLVVELNVALITKQATGKMRPSNNGVIEKAFRDEGFHGPDIATMPNAHASSASEGKILKYHVGFMNPG